MGNENSKSQQNLLWNEEKNPLARMESLLNQERRSIKAKDNSFETKELLNAIDYFISKERILDAESRHGEEIQQAQRQLQESKQSEQLVSSLYCSTIDKQIEEAKLQYKQAQEEIELLNIQLQAYQEDNHIEDKSFDKQLNLLKAERQKQKQQLLKEYQQFQNTTQNLVEQLKNDAEEKTNNINNQKDLLQRQLVEKQNQLKLLKEELVIKQEKQQQIMDQQIEQQRRVQQRRVQEMLKAVELSKAKTEGEFKKQLEKMNPQQEVNQSQIEFVKQFQAVQEDKLTVEQVKVIETKHQQVEQVLLKQIKDYEEKPKNFLSKEEKNIIYGQQGVLLLHAMLVDQGINAFLTDKPMQQLEQTIRGSYQQKIIQCGIQDSSSYFTANYYSPQYIEQQILEAQSLDNYIQNFKNDMASKIAEKDVTPLNIQVFSVTSQPPSIKFKIYSQSGQKIDIKDKDFKSLGIDVQTQNLLDKAELSIDMFEPIHNMTWDNLKEKSDYRGALQFKNRNRPTPQIYNYPLGYQGLGLKVLDRYGQDQRWIRADTRPDTWIVLYHGTGYQNLKGIMDQHNIKPGCRNKYGGYKCRITGNIIKKGEYQNTYLTDDVQEAEPYSILLNKKGKISYSLVFQCRVNPKKVMSPESRPEYYTVENPLEEIRPYRLLIKEIHN